MITLKNGLVFTNNQWVKTNIIINDNKITEISNQVKGETIDCHNLVIMPSFIDPHVHLREPGYEYKETIKTGTLAAARGGYTRVFLMPNLKPVPDDLDKITQYQKMIQKDALIKCDIISSITKGQLGLELSPFKELDPYVIGYSDDGKGVKSSNIIYEMIQQTNKPIFSHSEDESLLYQGIVHEGLYNKEHHLKGILDISETVQLARDLVIINKYNHHYHLCHVSAKESLELIKYYKKRNAKITVEVTPHHLVLNENDLIDDGNYKMNPPLRSLEDQKALIKGIKSNLIDCIATDHAPHSENEKNLGLEKSFFGIIGLETSFPILYTKLVKTKIISLKKLISLLSLNVSQIFKIKSHEIIVGNDANITIVNIKDKYCLDKNLFASKARNTPFHNLDVYGKIIYTIYDGKIVYRELENND